MNSKPKLSNLRKLAYESPASQDGFEMFQMLRHVIDLDPSVIVEIGCDGGGFLHTLTKLFPEAQIIGIDNNERKELDPYHMIFADSQLEETKHKLEMVLDNQIDFLFLDADHNYESVKREFQLYAPMVRPGGIIGFHDTNNRGIDGVSVDRFMRELDTSHSFETADFRAGQTSPGTRIIWV